MRPIYIHDESVHNLSAPREVVPLILDLVHPKSVVDVGCGTGTWLKAFEEKGITDYLGIDGHYVDPSMLKIPKDKFYAHDLQRPIFVNRKFDLVISLEVGEHLHENCADIFVETLSMLGEVIVFSAAIPGQQGQNHINEQWPEYWEEKFLKYGLFFHDVIRPKIWRNPKVDYWYSQNIFLLKKEKLMNQPFNTLSLVHPNLHLQNVFNHKQYKESLLDGKQGIRISSRIFFNAIIYKIRSFFQL